MVVRRMEDLGGAGLKPNGVMMAMLVRGLARIGDLEGAEWWFRRICGVGREGWREDEEKGWPLGREVKSVLVGYAGVGRGWKVVELLELMGQRGIPVGAREVHLVMERLTLHKQFVEAKRVMELVGVRNGVVGACKPRLEVLGDSQWGLTGWWKKLRREEHTAKARKLQLR
ncbi:hypothetical protein HDV00_011170 [Rhizophlyctis rosea]|nr:hypothetical protein HDV00_011170 [Rhizophlyctis rosea]